MSRPRRDPCSSEANCVSPSLEGLLYGLRSNKRELPKIGDIVSDDDAHTSIDHRHCQIQVVPTRAGEPQCCSMPNGPHYSASLGIDLSESPGAIKKFGNPQNLGTRCRMSHKPGEGRYSAELDQILWRDTVRPAASQSSVDQECSVTMQRRIDESRMDQHVAVEQGYGHASELVVNLTAAQPANDLALYSPQRVRRNTRFPMLPRLHLRRQFLHPLIPLVSENAARFTRFVENDDNRIALRTALHDSPTHRPWHTLNSLRHKRSFSNYYHGYKTIILYCDAKETIVFLKTALPGPLP